MQKLKVSNCRQKNNLGLAKSGCLRHDAESQGTTPVNNGRCASTLQSLCFRDTTKKVKTAARWKNTLANHASRRSLGLQYIKHATIQQPKTT